jgi:enoyl-CoA hydratase/carnithine racemase
VTEVLLQEDSGGVLVLTLNRPEVRNALNAELVRALHAALRRRYGDVFTRMSLYTPYAVDPEITARIVSDLNAPAP